MNICMCYDCNSSTYNKIGAEMTNLLPLSPIDRLAEYYASKPSLQALAQFLPAAGQLSALLLLRAEEIAKKRANIFFEELNNGSLELTSEIIQSEDFVHRYVITAKAAVNTFRHEKIRRFARLLQTSLHNNAVKDTDEYEEYLQIIDDISEREYSLLCLLERFEVANPVEGEPPKESDHKDCQEYLDVKRANLFWNHFLSESSEFLGISIIQVNDMLSRLIRTGCYQTLVSHGFIDKIYDRGKLTSTWFKIRALVKEQNKH